MLAIGNLVSMLLLGAASTAYAQGTVKDAKVSAKAREHFNAGVAYIDDPSGSKWEEAYREFRAAYAESKSWRILNNIGVCALNLERDEEAIEAYTQYLKLGGKDVSDKNRAQVEKDIAMLKASLASVSITVDLPDAKITDERVTANGGLVINRYNVQGKDFRVGIHPGHHKFTVSGPEGKASTWEFEAEPGSNQIHEFRLHEEAKPAVAPAATPTTANASDASRGNSGTSTWVYVGAGATAVFAVTATVTGIVALSKQSDFDKAKDDGNLSRAKDLKDSGERFALITDIGIGAAVVAAGLTTYAYFTQGKGEAEKTSRVLERGTWQLAPFAGVDRAGIAVHGAF
ncbi:MAG: hypothetical protein QM784_08160 [Polyangiaceae bacterium]